MYHGEQVPGFPAHPHRGFETVTIARSGLIDHSDSLGAAARFGQGDVQWLTAGKGIVHAEMFPLLHDDRPNPCELFQIWLNLPAARKMAEPHFTMFWSRDIPVLRADGAEVSVVAGALPGAGAPLAPPPESWAAQADADVAIWTLKLQPGARFTLPAAASGGVGQGTRRVLYFFAGDALTVAGHRVTDHVAMELDATQAVELVNGGTFGECLLLQARPIGEPVAQYGPFVMNTQAEIQQAFSDYQRTRFGGWPWGSDAPTHGQLAQGRFARRPGGVEETPAPAA